MARRAGWPRNPRAHRASWRRTRFRSSSRSGPLAGTEVTLGRRAHARPRSRRGRADPGRVGLEPARCARARRQRLPPARSRQHERRARERVSCSPADLKHGDRFEIGTLAFRYVVVARKGGPPIHHVDELAPTQAHEGLRCRQRPRTIGNFAIERELGSGGMGVVLLGRHASLERLAVLKRMRPDLADSEELIQRFAREARAAAAVHHENVVAVYDWIAGAASTTSRRNTWTGSTCAPRWRSWAPALAEGRAGRARHRARARGGARARHGAPRPQARERAARPRRRGEDRRLRHRARRQRRRADAHGCRRRDPSVHGPRAAPRRARRHARRSVLRWAWCSTSCWPASRPTRVGRG